MDASGSQGAVGGCGSGAKAGRGGAAVKRPMNSFLIFCKRHRALVHAKHPTVDNRNVTRMLGDLWKSILPEERAAYENLSKQVGRKAILKVTKYFLTNIFCDKFLGYLHHF